MREVERGTFSPLVFSCSGGIGPAATVVYKRLATLISEKRGHPYSQTLFWIRCKLSYSLLRAAVMCIAKRIKVEPSRMQSARSGY